MQLASPAYRQPVSHYRAHKQILKAVHVAASRGDKCVDTLVLHGSLVMAAERLIAVLETLSSGQFLWINQEGREAWWLRTMGAYTLASP